MFILILILFILKTNRKGETCLYYAVQGRQKEIVQLLCEYGANSAIENINSNTPFALAIKYHYSEIVEILEIPSSKLTRKKTILNFAAGTTRKLTASNRLSRSIDFSSSSKSQKKK